MKRSAARWLADADRAGQGRLASNRVSPAVALELERLRRENDRLQIERDTLVKAVNWLSSCLNDRDAVEPRLRGGRPDVG